MSFKYEYNLTQDLGSNEIGDSLEVEINTSGIAPNLLYYTKAGEDIEVFFDSELSPQEKTELDTIMANHLGNVLQTYKDIVSNAILFFNSELIRFSAENITMGITQLNKTKEVADYLQNVMRYGQSGSLYEVVNEVDTLIANGVPFELSPFVTEPRLNVLKANVLEYLS